LSRANCSDGIQFVYVDDRGHQRTTLTDALARIRRIKIPAAFAEGGTAVCLLFDRCGSRRTFQRADEYRALRRVWGLLAWYAPIYSPSRDRRHQVTANESLDSNQRAWTTEFSVPDEPLGVLGLVVAQQAGLFAAQLPACGDAIRAGEAGLGQGCFDPAAYFGFCRGFGCE
jgi:hypothetical protein